MKTSDMCVVWTRTLTASVTLVLICDVFATDGSQHKVYPHGNHWAVGHLMGKKSADEQTRLQEPDGVIAAAGETLQPDRNTDLRLLRVLQTLARNARQSAQQTDASHPTQQLMTTERQSEETQTGGGDILQALGMKHKLN